MQQVHEIRKIRNSVHFYYHYLEVYNALSVKHWRLHAEILKTTTQNIHMSSSYSRKMALRFGFQIGNFHSFQRSLVACFVWLQSNYIFTIGFYSMDENRSLWNEEFYFIFFIESSSKNNHFKWIFLHFSEQHFSVDEIHQNNESIKINSTKYCWWCIFWQCCFFALFER